MGDNDEVKELQKGITTILIAIGEMQTEIKQISRMVDKFELTEKLAIQLEQSVKSAHHRIDRLEKKVNELEDKLEMKFEKEKEDRKWLLGFIPGAIAILWKVFDFFKKGGM